MYFTDLKLADALLKGLAERGFEQPTPIQEKTIPLSLENKDVIACAKTGSGKTLAFMLPIAHKLISAIAEAEEAQEGKRLPSALVLAPTRELVLQIETEISTLIKDTEIKSVAIFGGVDYDKQRKALSQDLDIIIATPGRLIDFVKQKQVDLSKVTNAVLDEADRMLDMGFIDDVKFILSKTPEEKQVSLFSATLDYTAFYSVYEHMRYPEEVLINPELIDHNKITQEVLHLGRDEKLAYLVKYLQSTDEDPVIVFTNTKNFVESIVDNLRNNEIAAQGLSSTVSQNKRIRILNDFKLRKFRVMVATDVASRGLHIEDVALVVNFDVPQDPESYVHRIGRTARAGKDGRSLCFCSEIDYNHLSAIEKYLDYKLPVVHVEEELIKSLDEVTIKEPAGRRPERGDRRDRRDSRDRRDRGNRDRNRDRDRGRRPERESRERGRGRERNRDRDRGDRKREHKEKVFDDGFEKTIKSDVHIDEIPDYPTAAGKNKKGLWARIKGIFSGKKKAPEPVAPEPEEKPRKKHHKRKGGHHNKGQKGHNNRQHRGKKPRNNRGPRKPRQNKPQ